MDAKYRVEEWTRWEGKMFYKALDDRSNTRYRYLHLWLAFTPKLSLQPNKYEAYHWVCHTVNLFHSVIAITSVCRHLDMEISCLGSLFICWQFRTRKGWAVPTKMVLICSDPFYILSLKPYYWRDVILIPIFFFSDKKPRLREYKYMPNSNKISIGTQIRLCSKLSFRPSWQSRSVARCVATHRNVLMKGMKMWKEMDWHQPGFAGLGLSSRCRFEAVAAYLSLGVRFS